MLFARKLKKAFKMNKSENMQFIFLIVFNYQKRIQNALAYYNKLQEEYYFEPKSTGFPPKRDKNNNKISDDGLRVFENTYMHHLNMYDIKSLPITWDALLRQYTQAMEFAMNAGQMEKLTANISGCFEASIGAMDEWLLTASKEMEIKPQSKSDKVMEVDSLEQITSFGIPIVDPTGLEEMSAQEMLERLKKVVKLKGSVFPEKEVLELLINTFGYENVIASPKKEVPNEIIARAQPPFIKKNTETKNVEKPNKKENLAPPKPVKSEITQKRVEIVEQPKKANKAFKNADFLANIQKLKEEAQKKYKEPSENVSAPISKEPLSKKEEVLHENFQELLRAKIIELPTYIKPETFEEYLKGNINLDKLLENKPKTRAHQRAQEDKAGNRPTAAMMAELQQKLGIKSAQSQEMPQKPSVQDQPKGEFKQETPEKFEITPDSILKKLIAAADVGMAGVNKPLAGNNGVVNYLFNKTAIVEERQLRKEFLQMVSADKQAGRAVQNKEAFLAHAKKFGTVQKNLEDNEPKAPTPKKPAALTISRKQQREEVLTQPPVPEVASKVVDQHPSQNKENINPRLQQANLQSKHHSQTEVYMQTWNKYNEKLSALMPDKKYGFITNNMISHIHKYLKQHEKGGNSATEQYKRLTELRNELLKSHSNNPTLMQMISEFCTEYKKLPPPPKHTINISRKM